MKRLLFVLPSYRWGGDSTALYNLLDRIDPNRYHVDLFPLLDEGEQKGRYTNCHFLNSSLFLESMLRKFHPSLRIQSFLALIIKSLNALSRNHFSAFVYRSVGKSLVRKHNYDAVIAWTEFEPTTFVSFFPHNNKLAWLHCDYAQNNHSKEEDLAYKRLDRIICVSNCCRESFLRLFPELAPKTKVLYNILGSDSIIHKAQQKIDDFPRTEGVYNFISYGRIAPVKRFSLIPEIARKVWDAGVRFHWCILGPNQHPDELDRILANIKEHQVTDIVEYLGARENPFPYLQNADLIINTSLSEALPYSVLEPKILGIPIINSDIPAAREILTDGVDGLIAPIDEISSTIVSFCKDTSLRKKIQRGAKQFVYDDISSLQGFEELFG